jgi:DNA-binding NarL/FixJ family response regulator
MQGGTKEEFRLAWKRRKNAQAMLRGSELFPCLSERNQFIMGHHSRGTDVKEIAQELGVCEETVRRIIRKKS